MAVVWSKSNVWRGVMAFFAVIWLLLALMATWDPVFIPFTLIALGNACAAWEGFDRYGNLIVGIGVISTVFNVLLVLLIALVVAFASALGQADWSRLSGGGHS
jgi:hypothetical protein